MADAGRPPRSAVPRATGRRRTGATGRTVEPCARRCATDGISPRGPARSAYVRPGSLSSHRGPRSGPSPSRRAWQSRLVRTTLRLFHVKQSSVGTHRCRSHSRPAHPPALTFVPRETGAAVPRETDGTAYPPQLPLEARAPPAGSPSRAGRHTSPLRQPHMKRDRDTQPLRSAERLSMSSATRCSSACHRSHRRSFHRRRGGGGAARGGRPGDGHPSRKGASPRYAPGRHCGPGRSRARSGRQRASSTAPRASCAPRPRNDDSRSVDASRSRHDATRARGRAS